MISIIINSLICRCSKQHCMLHQDKNHTATTRHTKDCKVRLNSHLKQHWDTFQMIIKIGFENHMQSVLCKQFFVPTCWMLVLGYKGSPQQNYGVIVNNGSCWWWKADFIDWRHDELLAMVTLLLSRSHAAKYLLSKAKYNEFISTNSF